MSRWFLSSGSFRYPNGARHPVKLSFLRFQKIRGMDFLGNILAVHLVQDILERGDVVVIRRVSIPSFMAI